jgi:histidine ammonia-lyase
MNENVFNIIAIELLAACQGIDLLRPLKTSPILEKIHHLVREHIPYYDKDRYFAPDIAAAKALIQTGKIKEVSGMIIFK